MDEVVPAAPETKPSASVQVSSSGHNFRPKFFTIAITHRKDAVYPATIVGIPPMEGFYIGGASVKLFLPIFKMNFPEIVDIALPAESISLSPSLAAAQRPRYGLRDGQLMGKAQMAS